MIDPVLIEFAKVFSENYKTFSCGIFPNPVVYFSSEKKYRVNYYDKILNELNREELKTLTRVSMSTGAIDLSHSKLVNNSEYTKDFVFFMVLWGALRFATKSEIEADTIATNEYLLQNRSKRDLLLGYLKMFEHSLTDMNRKRFENLKTIVKLRLEYYEVHKKTDHR